MMERAPEQADRDGFVPLVSRREELKALAAAFCGRASRLVSGPAGIGKTRLIDEALAMSRQPAVRARRPAALHDLLVQLAEGLSCPVGRFRDAAHATSSALKPAVLNALRLSPRCVVLDDVSGADPRMYRFLQQVYYLPGSCLTAGARSRESLGHLRKLLWDPREEIAMKPLKRAEAGTLFEAACAAWRLDSLEIDEFRGKVLAAAQGNPGQILAMCRLAARPEYQSGRHIKFLPLRIDVLTAFV